MKLNRVKEIRKELHMTVRDLEDSSGLSHAAITKIENFKSIPSQLSMMQISKGLNKRVGEVFLLDYNKIDVNEFWLI